MEGQKEEQGRPDGPPRGLRRASGTGTGTNDLRKFRQRLHDCFGRRADALFELGDAVLSAGTVSSPVHLSLAPVHRRGWGSLYAALSKGSIDDEMLRDLLARKPLRKSGSGNVPRVYAVDQSAWPRCDAEASPERGYYYHPSRHSAGQPIVAGWSYQLVAELGFERDSWVAPVDARRVPPGQDANVVAAEQVKALVCRVCGMKGGCYEPPLFVFDAGYDPVRLQQGLEGCRAQLLVRLHSTRVFYADRTVPRCHPVGRPFVHGNKFDFKDSSSWHRPSAEYGSEDAGYGKVRVRAWSGLHPKTRRAGERYGSKSAAVVRGTVVLVEVERLPRGERRRKPKKLWLWWHGKGEPDLDLIWRGYVRRFDVEHVIKTFKSKLGWTTPRVRHPEQADRWTWLILAAYTQLRLARGVVADRRLPWERPLAIHKLTPTRVLRNFASLLPTLDTPASAPKPCGRSPGRPKGSVSGPAKRYPAVKKAA